MPISVPTDIAGCQWWLDASDASTFTFTSGVLVQQWNDKSGNARHAVYASGNPANPPSRNGTQNGLATVVWVDQTLYSLGVTQALSQPYTVFIVGNITSTGVIAGMLSVGPQIFRHTAFSNDIVFRGADGNEAHTALETSNYHIIMGIWNGGSSVQRIDQGVAYNATVTMDGDAFSEFRIGHRNDAAEGLQGFVAEVIIYNTALNSTDYGDVETYLYNKWFGAAGTNITPTAVAATFVVPTPTFNRTTTPTPTRVIGAFTIPTPAISRTTRPSPTAVASTFVVPTPTFNRTTTPTPTAVAATFTVPAPVVSTAVSATLTKVTGVFTIPTPVPTVQTNISVTAVAATFVVPTPTFTRTTTPTPTAVAATFVIPSPSVTTGSNVNIGATALAGTFTIPTPAVSGTQVAATVAAQTWVIPTPAIAGTQIAATAVAATFVIPTPSVTTGSTTSVTPAAVAMVAAVPTPTFNRTTTPTPTAVAMICAVPTPGYTASAAILATVVAAVFVIRGGVPTGQLIGGNATQTLTQAQGATQTITVQGARQELNP